MTQPAPKRKPGRPPGTTAPRIDSDSACAVFDSWRAPGESWAALARRLGIQPQAMERARRTGVTVRQMEAWTVRIADNNK